MAQIELMTTLDRGTDALVKRQLEKGSEQDPRCGVGESWKHAEEDMRAQKTILLIILIDYCCAY
jgi:hypothetical protein